jgi:hypothetical protein
MAREEEIRAKYDLDAEKAAKELEQTKFEELCINWQLE